jgi:formylglycine-generating enzyme required for sulfatase activity
LNFDYRIPEYQGLAFIGSGNFTMGSPPAEPDRRNNETQHTVSLKGYYIGKYEVTQGEYAAIMGNNPSTNQGDTMPVEHVSWYDAINYCNARSRAEGLEPAYTIQGTRVSWNRGTRGYRLPTEAEWEYACRAGTTTAYYTGDDMSQRSANFDGQGSVPVGQYPMNPWGLYDMTGNVWEWCWDKLRSYEDAFEDNTGPSSTDVMVVRGGGWYNGKDRVRSAYRGSDIPNYRDHNLGFRVVRQNY